jgi:hypothetical protein
MREAQNAQSAGPVGRTRWGNECVMDRAHGAVSKEGTCDQGESIIAEDRTIVVGFSLSIVPPAPSWV